MEQKKLLKIEYGTASLIKDFFLFSVWFGIFFFVMVISSGQSSFFYNLFKHEVIPSVSEASVLSQKATAFKNPKIIKLEKVNNTSILASTEFRKVIPASTSVVTASKINEDKPVRIRREETPLPIASSKILPVKESPSSNTVLRRKYTSGDILPTRIVIDKIGIDIVVMNPEWNDIPTLTEALKAGAVRYPQSGLLGENANILLFGHSAHLKVIYNKAYKAFNDIGDLVEGDEIKVFSNQKIYIYKVETVNLVKNTEERVDLVSSTPKLTLVTCNNFGTKEDRFVVVAELFSSSYLL